MMASVFGACKQKVPAKYIDETYTLGPDDKRPFGGYITKATIDTIFTSAVLESNSNTFTKWYSKKSDEEEVGQGDMYIILSPAIRAYEKEAEDMVNYMRSGNTLVLITDALSEELEEALRIRVMNDAENLPYQMQLEMMDTRVRIKDSTQPGPKNFSYYYHPFLHAIYTGKKHKGAETIAVNSQNKPTIVRMPYGRGQLIVATNARAFGNYFLLSGQNHAYLLHMAGYFPADPYHVVWDAFYQRNINRSPEGYSVFDALFSIPPLRWSFWILLVLALIWVITNLRRRQRMIPILQPNTNTTVSFVETIAQLYFNRQDHANIARKMTTHFLDYLRTNFYMPPNIASDEWADILSQKTGLSKADAKETADLMEKAQQAEESFTSTDLFKLHAFIAQVKSVDTRKIAKAKPQGIAN
ncbi:MAG TPA: DUF4350 domain-containing protein [Phnomibacter sp.]|nr:DUF4350 domain-containing protein [Phnomibacter sp.]